MNEPTIYEIGIKDLTFGNDVKVVKPVNIYRKQRHYNAGECLR